MSMNPFLAELYGTRAVIGATEDNSDVEKLAEAHFLDGILQSEGIDVDQLEDGVILKLAYEIFGDDSHLVKSAMEEGAEPEKDPEKDPEKEPEKEESTEEKTAEADLLGRIMAHSMVQELGQIEMEKEAGKAGEAWQAGKGLLSRLKGKASAGAAAAKGKGESALEALKAKGKGAVETAKETAKKHPKSALGAAAGLGAAGGAGATYAGMRKKGSAIDVLAEQRAFEILAENGIDPTAETTETKLASAVEQRAWEMLAEAGYTQAEE
jgi:hypothetical protein